MATHSLPFGRAKFEYKMQRGKILIDCIECGWRRRIGCEAKAWNFQGLWGVPGHISNSMMSEPENGSKKDSISDIYADKKSDNFSDKLMTSLEYDISLYDTVTFIRRRLSRVDLTGLNFESPIFFDKLPVTWQTDNLYLSCHRQTKLSGSVSLKLRKCTWLRSRSPEGDVFIHVLLSQACLTPKSNLRATTTTLWWNGIFVTGVSVSHFFVLPCCQGIKLRSSQGGWRSDSIFLAVWYYQHLPKNCLVSNILYTA